MTLKPLPVEALYHACDPAQFHFDTTAELEELKEVIGQARALDAISFGIGIKRQGYNLFALGPPGTGKQAVVTQLLSQAAAADAAPLDWCYVNNFDQPHKPRRLTLPGGQGMQLRRDMEELVEDLRTGIPAVFESDEYRARSEELEEEFKERQENAIDEIRRAAQEQGIALVRTPGGFAFAPLRGEEVISPKEFQALADEEKLRLTETIEKLQEQLQKILNQIPQWRREARDKLKALNEEVTMSAVGHLIDELRRRYTDHPAVLEYFDAVQRDVIKNVDDFRGEEEESQPLPILSQHNRKFRRYEVNVLVDHTGSQGAPVIYEGNPTYQNLVGRIEHIAMMGALITDFTLIKAGALHRANHGYLVLDALKVLQHPFAWEALKRALRSNEISIGTLEQMLSLVSTVSLEPEPVPLNLKVVLIGDRILYYLLYQLDPEFRELFKVAADFEDYLDRSGETQQLYARLIGTLARRDGLRPLDGGGVARVIEHGARLSGDAEKLSIHLRSLSDLMCEADYWAGRSGRAVITRADVQTAIDARLRRNDRMRERMHEAIHRGVLLIDTAGSRVGQINGLSVIDMGEMMFGTPTRITARVRMGEGEVVDIEREVELGGPIHSKGVLILSGFLGARYARERPLALSASIVFEQSYGEIEGDSASSAELYALLSALADVPISQALAVTGSVNQHGEVQAIGGVNEKIEGFFDVCRNRGLSGAQGVLIPASNVKDLMLRADVVEAVRQGKFAIHAITSIDGGIELLTGVTAGVADEKGEFPPGSVNGRVARQLAHFAEIRHEFGEHRKDGEG